MTLFLANDFMFIVAVRCPPLPIDDVRYNLDLSLGECGFFLVVISGWNDCLG